MTPAGGKARLHSFQVAKITLEMFEAPVPILTAEFLLQRDDGAHIGTLIKRRPIPLLFDEKEVSPGELGHFTKPVAEALRTLLKELELDTLPELFEGSETGNTTLEGTSRPQGIPPDW